MFNTATVCHALNHSAMEAGCYRCLTEMSTTRHALACLLHLLTWTGQGGAASGHAVVRLRHACLCTDWMADSCRAWTSSVTLDRLTPWTAGRWPTHSTFAYQHVTHGRVTGLLIVTQRRSILRDTQAWAPWQQNCFRTTHPTCISVVWSWLEYRLGSGLRVWVRVMIAMPCVSTEAAV